MSAGYTDALHPDADIRLTEGVMFRRVVGWMLDSLLLACLGVVLWFGVAAFAVLTLGFGAPLFAVLAFLPAVYGWLFLASPLQATPGQAMMGLVVVRDADLGPPTAMQALVCVLAYCATIALGAVWCAVALVTARHRTGHDILSGLVVVRRQMLKVPFNVSLTGAPRGWNMDTDMKAPNAFGQGGRPFV